MNKISYLDWIQAGILLVLSPFFLFPRVNLTWLYLVVPIIIIFRWWKEGAFFKRTILDWGIGLLLIQVFVTCFVVPDLWFSLPKIAGVVFGVLVFYSMLHVLEKENWIKWGVYGFLGMGGVFTVFGVVGIGMRFGHETDLGSFNDFLYKNLIKIFPHYNWHLPGAEEGFNPNGVAGTLTLIFPLFLVALYAYLKKREGYYFGRKRNVFLIVLFTVVIIMGLVLYISQSVGAWIALVLTMILIYAFVKARRKSVAVILTALSLVLAFFLNSLINIQISDEAKARGTFERKSFIRMKLWNIGIEAAGEHPLTGIGMNMLRRGDEISYKMAHSHNHLIHTAAEMGIPGLAAYLAVLVGAGVMVVLVWRRGKTGWMRMSVLGLGAGQMAHFIWGMGDTFTLGGKPGIVFWVSLSLITGIYQNCEL